MGSLPKAKKKNFPKSVHEMSKEMLQETLKKKKECDAKALEIVEKLCEASIDEHWFLEQLQFINQCHFDDVTTERSILKTCGYPLCDNELQNVTPQQYHISTRYNKVFDITERKKFCSSSCYKSATYVKKQLFTSPLWFRDQEVIPKYKLLKAKSSMGEEVVLMPDKIKPEPEDVIKADVSKKGNFTDEKVNDLVKKCSDLKIDNSQDVFPDNGAPESTRDTNTSQKSDNPVGNLNKNDATLKEGDKNQRSNESNEVIGDNGSRDKSKFSSRQVDNPKKSKMKTKDEDKPLDIISKIEKCVLEWFSLDTYFYLFGEEKLKELFSDKVDEIKQVLNSKLSMASVRDKVDRMIQLYELLDADLFGEREVRRDLKPLPDYAVLKQERDSVHIKVKAFYQGNLEVKQPPVEEKKEEKETDDENEVVSLPLVDAHAQIPHRRKILLDKLNRVLPNLLQVFSSDYILQMSEVRNLISTFALAAHNITFKPTEWYLVGIIIIKLLSLKNKLLESDIKSESSQEQISLILENYGLQRDYLDDLVFRLTDSKNLVKKLDEISR